ncbi:MAG: nitrite/sulfite reductase [Granulosicoccaceae bacterium]
MYQYNDINQETVDSRCREFRDQVERRIAGTLSESEFKPLRLMNGLYLQLHAYMLRVAIPYGVLSSSQLSKLADISDKYDRGYGHFTTRQNIQFNWPTLEDMPDLLEELATVQMHAIQTSGNCIRNITGDPLAGVAADEDVDPRPICEWLRQWSTLHPEFRYLPRKFKFAITGSANDRAAIKVHDIGLRLRKGTAGDLLIDLWLGGGQGRTPKIAQLFKRGLKVEELLPYLEATLRVYNMHGRRDNKYKARIKILLSEIGLESLQAQVQEEYEALDKGPFANSVAELKALYSHFALPLIDIVQQSGPTILGNEKLAGHEVQRWYKQNTRDHKLAGFRSVMISLKPAGGIPGDATSAQMRALASIAKQYSRDELRVTHRQNIVMPWVAEKDLLKVWQALVDGDLAESNIDLPSDIIACPGMDYCALATARSIPVAQDISKKLRETELQTDIGKLAINISGCINACAHHHVADIGILGLDRAGVENYQITLGGRSDENARVGERMGPGLSADELPATIERVIKFYIKERHDDESFSLAYDRIGKAGFKPAVYGEVNDDAGVTA